MCRRTVAHMINRNGEIDSPWILHSGSVFAFSISDSMWSHVAFSPPIIKLITSISLKNLLFSISLHLYLCLFLHVSICLSVFLPVYLCVCLWVSQSLASCLYLLLPPLSPCPRPISLSLPPSFSLSLSICLSFFLFFWSIYYLYLLSICLSIYNLSIYLFYHSFLYYNYIVTYLSPFLIRHINIWIFLSVHLSIDPLINEINFILLNHLFIYRFDYSSACLTTYHSIHRFHID